MSAFGRKRTLVLPDFGVSERPLLGKADIQGTAQNFHIIDQLGTSAFCPEADIRLISGLTTAFDPKRTFKLNPKCCRISANLSGESSD